MFIEENYIIGPDFMCMVGIYDRNAKLCTLVREQNRTFIVDQSPLEVLTHSIRCIGYDLKGAMATARLLLGNKHMCPVMVNPIHRICVFPHKSANHVEAIWFNPYHIARTNSLDRKAKIEFSNGMIMAIPSKLYSFNHKLQTAEQFMKMTVELGSHSNFPKKGPKKGA
ncbi:competence protein ComK [Bacillus sp. FJAT-29814]|uniref:competence protein ComK n=1 Tax=Bacillus sp. FJAT-29814 TaxID=1729688 RepID=UPI0008371DE8|nr:competence protein ComK [Bacillus sp. FJAT-29814]